MSENKKHINSDKEVLVKVEGVSKKFCKDLKRSLWYGMQDLNPFTSASNSSELRKDEFWAVKDVSFELRRGECLGLIGHNGAGKSTLLKMLNGLINPDEGKITIKGRVGALIELGAGFNPILTGRENIYNNGAVLGFTKKEIDTKVEEIIDFAEIREFIDMPVQNYSSGMRVRLGFAVAAQMEPDVLIIDEVLAVGDIGFRIKCYNKISELLQNTTIIFVSHSMVQISKMCNEVLLLDKGSELYFGRNIGVGVQKYLQGFKQVSYRSKLEGEVRIENVEIVSSKDKILNYLDDLILKINFINNNKIEVVDLDISFVDKEQKTILISNVENLKIINMKSKQIIFKKLPITGGLYSLSISVRKSDGKKLKKVYSWYTNIESFEVRGGDINRFCPVQIESFIYSDES